MSAAAQRATVYERSSGLNADADRLEIGHTYLSAAEHAETRDEMIDAVVSAGRYLDSDEAALVTLRVQHRLSERGARSTRLIRAAQERVEAFVAFGTPSRGIAGLRRVLELAEVLLNTGAHWDAYHVVRKLTSSDDSALRTPEAADVGHRVLRVLERVAAAPNLDPTYRPHRQSVAAHAIQFAARISEHGSELRREADRIAANVSELAR